jgi:hypothetical protein
MFFFFHFPYNGTRFIIIFFFASIYSQQSLSFNTNIYLKKKETFPKPTNERTENKKKSFMLSLLKNLNLLQKFT